MLTEETLLSVADDFSQKWGSPHWVGTMDGKRVIQAPHNSGSTFFNIIKKLLV